LTEFSENASLWFKIIGIYGGFNLHLQREESGEVLIAESWSRIVSGSGMRHRVAPFEVVLLKKGFV